MVFVDKNEMIMEMEVLFKNEMMKYKIVIGVLGRMIWRKQKTIDEISGIVKDENGSE